jgi:hypothetical protein
MSKDGRGPLRNRLADASSWVVTATLPAGLAVTFAAIAIAALTLSRDPAGPMIGLAALAISLFNLWRAEWQPARVSALLVDHPTVRVAGNASAVRWQLSQPLVIENVGGTPCVLAGVELFEPWLGGGNWFSEGIALHGLSLPTVLRKREPLVASLVFDQSAYGTSPRGERFDLASALEDLPLPDPLIARVNIVFASSGRTRRHAMAAHVNAEAMRKAFGEAIERAGWADDADVDLTMPGDDQVTLITERGLLESAHSLIRRVADSLRTS